MSSFPSFTIRIEEFIRIEELIRIEKLIRIEELVRIEELIRIEKNNSKKCRSRSKQCCSEWTYRVHINFIRGFK